MTFARGTRISDPDTIPRMPSWVASTRAQTLEDVAFLSGAVLSHLHVLLERQDVPHALMRDRLALRSAEACVAFSGRSERAAELRDALHLLRPGDLPGPAGKTYLSWRRVVERPVSIKSLCRAFPELDVAQIAGWTNSEKGATVTRAAMV